jgi:hypothetical protein
MSMMTCSEPPKLEDRVKIRVDYELRAADGAPLAFGESGGAYSQEPSLEKALGYCHEGKKLYRRTITTQYEEVI